MTQEQRFNQAVVEARHRLNQFTQFMQLRGHTLSMEDFIINTLSFEACLQQIAQKFNVKWAALEARLMN